MKITTKHMDAITTALADVLGPGTITAQSILGDAPVYTDLAAVDAAVIGEALRDANVSAPPLKRGAAARFFVCVVDGAPTCNRCGRLPLRLEGSTWYPVTDPTCPVDGGLYVAPESPAQVTGWADGRAYPAGTTHDADRIPITDDAIRAARRVDASITAACRETGASIVDLCAALRRSGASAASVLLTLESPRGTWHDDTALRVFAQQAKGAASKEPAGGGGGRPPREDAAEGHTWTPKRIRDLLASLYVSTLDARRVASEAELPTRRIDFSGSAQTFWFAVLEEAKRSGRVADVLRVVATEYPRHRDVREALASVSGAHGSTDVLARLNALLPAQLETIIFKLGAPRSMLPSTNSAQSNIAIALIQWAESSGKSDELARLVR